jgi:hypothetical protein
MIALFTMARNALCQLQTARAMCGKHAATLTGQGLGLPKLTADTVL